MNSMSILLVDGETASLEQLTDILKMLGYGDLHPTTSGSEAWTMLRIKRFACVFSAWNVPEISGLALLKLVRSDDKTHGLPFLLADSAYTQAKVIEAGRAEATGLIVKPYQSSVIKAKMKRVGDPQVSFISAEVTASFDQAMRFLDQGNNESALGAFEKLLRDGESAEIYYNIGYIKTAQGKFAEAIEAFRKATELDRLFAKAYEGMGRALRALGREAEAQECLNRAAEIYMNSQREEKAQEVLDEILKEDPKTINVFNTLGVLHRKKGDYAGALKAYERALRIHPTEPYIYYNIGHIYVEMKDLRTAKANFQKALALDANFNEAREALDAMLMAGV